MSHPEVPLISFTGSQPTAERITQLSAPHCKKLSLELGGKNPAIIFEDANLEECVPTTVRSSFANQVCPLPVSVCLFVFLFQPCGPVTLDLFYHRAKPGLSRSTQCYFSGRRIITLCYSTDYLFSVSVNPLPCRVTASVQQVCLLELHNFYQGPAMGKMIDVCFCLLVFIELPPVSSCCLNVLSLIILLPKTPQMHTHT